MLAHSQCSSFEAQHVTHGGGLVTIYEAGRIVWQRTKGDEPANTGKRICRYDRSNLGCAMIVTATRSQTQSRVVFTSIDARLMEHKGPNMDAEKKMTPADFDALLPRLGRLTVDTVKIARSVLVDGQRPFEAAAQHGTSRQRVNSILKRVEEAAREFPADWKRVDVWLPPEIAAEVEAMAQRARADHAGTDSGSSGASA